jgi:hypothetical protein
MNETVKPTAYLTGLLWFDISEVYTYLDRIKTAYTHVNPSDELNVFITYLIKNSKIGVPYGNKEKIKDIIGEFNVVDKRIAIPFDIPKVSKLALRDYQETAMSEIKSLLADGLTEFNLSGKPGCVHGDTEYYTPNGWKKIKDYTEGDSILVCDEEGRAFFEEPLYYLNLPNDRWYTLIADDKPVAKLSAEHNVIHYNQHSEIVSTKCIDLFNSTEQVKLVASPHIRDCVNVDKIKQSVSFTRKYCFTTSTGMWVSRYNGVITVTGNSGKSFMLSNLLAELGLKTLIIANQKMLINQLSKEIEQTLGCQANVLSAKNTVLGDINVATSQFISQNPDVWYQIKEQVSVLVLDEAEALASPTVTKIFQRSPAKYKIYISATFSRSVDQRTDALVDFAGSHKIILHSTGNIVPTVLMVECPEVFIAPSDPLVYQTAKGRFFDYVGIHNKVLDIVKYSVNKNRQVLIGCDIQKVQIKLKDKLNDLGIITEILNGSTKEKDRLRILQDYDSGNIKVLIGFGVLNAGISIPKIQTIIRLSMPSSIEKLEQFIGRGVRSFEGKEGCYVIDLVFQGFNIKPRNTLYRLKSRTERWKVYKTTWDSFSSTLK